MVDFFLVMDGCFRSAGLKVALRCIFSICLIVLGWKASQLKFLRDASLSSQLLCIVCPLRGRSEVTTVKLGIHHGCGSRRCHSEGMRLLVVCDLWPRVQSCRSDLQISSISHFVWISSGLVSLITMNHENLRVIITGIACGGSFAACETSLVSFLLLDILVLCILVDRLSRLL